MLLKWQDMYGEHLTLCQYIMYSLSFISLFASTAPRVANVL